MKGLFSMLIKKDDPNSLNDFGIQTSKGIVSVPNSKLGNSNNNENGSDYDSEEDLEEQKKRKEEYEKRRNADLTLDALLQGKFSNDIISSDDLEYANFTDGSENMLRGGKELEIIKSSVEYLKSSMLRKGATISSQNNNSADFLDISLADKSELVVWVYKELREQQKRNEILLNEISKLRIKNEEKQGKIDNLQKINSELKKDNEILNKKIRKIAAEKMNFEKLVMGYSQKYQEIVKMESHEINKFKNVFYKFWQIFSKNIGK